MKLLLSDPVVLICSGIIFIGLISLFWAISKFRSLKSAPAQAWPADSLGLTLPQRGKELAAALTPPSVPPSSPAMNREVVERLESMTQRLTEMQSVLMKSPGSSGTDPVAGGVGQGFSPETIDKLLKIIGNVMQQVDILQKSMSPAKEKTEIKP